MATEETYLTPAGEDALRRELKQLTETRRPELVAQLNESRAAVALQRSAEERLALVDKRIKRIEGILGKAIIVDQTGKNEVIELRTELRLLEEHSIPSLSEDRREIIIQQEQNRKAQSDLLRKTKRGSEKTLEEVSKRLLKQIRELQAERKQVDAFTNEEKALNKELKENRNKNSNLASRKKEIEIRLDNIISIEHAEKLQEELKQLNNTRKPALAKKLKEAAAQGDLKENADYHDAKEQLGFVEGRVQQIEYILLHAIIIDTASGGDEARIGSTVIIKEVGGADEEEYMIVGSAEANPRERKISQKSPIGAALLGKKTGDRVKVDTPDGSLKFKILDIR